MDFEHIILLVLILSISPAFALKNPAAVYCEQLGFEYTFEKNIDTSISDYCIIDKIKYPAWDFYSGKVAKNYSYCAKEGYEIITVSDGKYSSESGGCVKKTDSLSILSKNNYILQDDLMDISLKLVENLSEKELINASDHVVNKTKKSFSLALNYDSQANLIDDSQKDEPNIRDSYFLNNSFTIPKTLIYYIVPILTGLFIICLVFWIFVRKKT